MKQTEVEENTKISFRELHNGNMTKASDFAFGISCIV